jgi:hypothetical protein
MRYVWPQDVEHIQFYFMIPYIMNNHPQEPPASQDAQAPQQDPPQEPTQSCMQHVPQAPIAQLLVVADHPRRPLDLRVLQQEAEGTTGNDRLVSSPIVFLTFKFIPL